MVDPGPRSFVPLMMAITYKSAPEYKNVEAFAQYLIDDERDTFNHEDLAALNYRTHRMRTEIRRELESYGFSLAAREPARRIRGFTSNPHDRWQAFPSHGGSGYEQIQGFGGQKG